MSNLEERTRARLAQLQAHAPVIATAALAIAMLQDGERLAELSAALERLARSGTPLATKGPPVCRRQFGRTRFVRPWEWRAI